ncbi:hypothetical protein DEV91_10123 [Phyllobacterium brassicacearum]|nr:hypothetical protein DEV91_10123 [Phyllobacterium brassicacearum]
MKVSGAYLPNANYYGRKYSTEACFVSLGNYVCTEQPASLAVIAHQPVLSNKRADAAENPLDELQLRIKKHDTLFVTLN